MSGSPRKSIAMMAMVAAACTPIGTHASRVVTEDGQHMMTAASPYAPSRGAWQGPPSWSHRLKRRRQRQHMERTARR